MKHDFDTLHHVGIAAWQKGELDTAIHYLQQAIALRPQAMQAYYNCGVVLQQLLRLDEAFSCYNRVLAHPTQFPNAYKAHMNQALILLMQGKLLEGWKKYEWRWRNSEVGMKQKKRTFIQPLWLGKTPLAGKTIFLHHEQGLGDTLQFCRYIPQVVALGAQVVVEVQASLLPLLRTLAGAESVTWVTPETPQDSLPAFDLHCPLLSLPLAFQTTLDSLPAAAPYLHADAECIAAWKTRLGKQKKPRVGLVWSGGTGHHNDRNRSLLLADLARHLPPNREYICLQKEIRQDDLAFLRSHQTIHTFESHIHDFGDTAALCALVDVVISVDTSVAHLAGALGRPLWLLVPFAPDWRWMLERTDSPWYPTATLYRQTALGDWNSVLQSIHRDLNAMEQRSTWGALRQLLFGNRQKG
jgi:tetratricopeptide (TPR) repeat protein